MKKSYSQKVARAFEIICYFLLLPAFISLIYPLFFLIGSLFSTSFGMFLLALMFLCIPAFGVLLFVGYIRHSRGKMNEGKIFPLWLGTILFNAIPLAITSYWFFITNSFDGTSYSSIDGGFFIIFNLFILLWIAGILFPANALHREFSQKYR
jgi:hypothetical protein